MLGVTLTHCVTSWWGKVVFLYVLWYCLLWLWLTRKIIFLVLNPLKSSRNINKCCFSHTSLFFILRLSSHSLFLYWSRIQTIRSTSEAAGAKATQQEEVICLKNPAVFRRLQLLLLWFIQLTLLCSKPNIPKSGRALCFFPCSSGLCWPKTFGLQRKQKEQTSSRWVNTAWMSTWAREGM